MIGSKRGDSWEQPERTINEASNTITNTTGTTVPMGRGVAEGTWEPGKSIVYR